VTHDELAEKMARLVPDHMFDDPENHPLGVVIIVSAPEDGHLLTLIRGSAMCGAMGLVQAGRQLAEASGDPLIMIKAAFLAAQMTGEIAERELPDLPRGEQHVPDTAPFPQHLRALLEGSGGQEG